MSQTIILKSISILFFISLMLGLVCSFGLACCGLACCGFGLALAWLGVWLGLLWLGLWLVWCVAWRVVVACNGLLYSLYFFSITY